MFVIQARLLWLTYNHDIEVKARLHGLLFHLLDDGVNSNVAQQSWANTGAMGAAMILSSIVCYRVTCAMASTVTSTVAHAMARAVAADVHRGMTPDGYWDGARRERWGSTPCPNARALRREGARGGRSPYIWRFGRDGWFGSHFRWNDVRHVCSRIAYFGKINILIEYVVTLLSSRAVKLGCGTVLKGLC